MPSPTPYPADNAPLPLSVREQDIEDVFIAKLRDQKYTHRPDIRDRAALEANFRQKFEALNRVRLTDAEFARLLDDLVSPDVFKTSVRLREKNDFEIVHQLRINTDYSHHRYDVILLINGVPVVQVELKTLGVTPRRAMEQIVGYKNDPGNGYTRTLLCFVQLFVVSNRDSTFYFANDLPKHDRKDLDRQDCVPVRFSKN